MFIFISIDLMGLKQGGRLHQVEDAKFFDIRNDNESFIVSLRKRKPFPSTYCLLSENRLLELGYGSPAGDHLNEEYLQISITDNGDLRIQRDVYCTLPLYYAYHEGKFVISNLYSVVAAELSQLTPDTQAINVAIAGKDLPDRRTPYSNIKTLEEHATLVLTGGKLQHIAGQERSWKKSLETPISEPSQFLDVLQQSFDHLIAQKLAKGHVAFEISGGLDSSALPLYIAKKRPSQQLLGVTMLFDGIYRATQKQKIEALQAAANIDIIEQKLEIGYNSPLQRVVQGGSIVPLPIPSPLEVYNEPTRFFAEVLHQRGIDIVITGIGGDELFEHIIDPQSYVGLGAEVYQKYEASTPPYMTSAHQRAVHRALNREGRVPLLSIVTHSASVNRNNTYIEHGIWPISQYADPYLVRFSQGLPAHFKANKNILRAFFQAHGFPIELYNSPQNEDFEPFFEEAFYGRTYDRLMDKLLSHSYTIASGYVDKTRLQATYNDAVTSRNSTWLYQLYCWMCTEIDLLYHKDKIAAHH